MSPLSTQVTISHYNWQALSPSLNGYYFVEKQNI